MIRIFGRVYGIPTTCFRYSMCMTRQSLSNPYTGAPAIFLSRLKNNNAPIVYEDGLQSRDFISIYDVVDINIMALNNEKTWGKVFNIGTGHAVTIKDVALIIAKILGKKLNPILHIHIDLMT